MKQRRLVGLVAVLLSATVAAPAGAAAHDGSFSYPPPDGVPDNVPVEAV